MGRIVVVDDAEILRSTLLKALRDIFKHEVYAFGQADEAEVYLEALGQNRGETLVVMDVRLDPRDRYPDGVAAARRLLEKWPELRVVFLTGLGASISEICPGNPPYISKPVTSLNALGAEIEMYLRAPPWRPPANLGRRKGDRE